jgi:hypothetical protein
VQRHIDAIFWQQDNKSFHFSDANFSAILRFPERGGDDGWRDKETIGAAARSDHAADPCR